MLKFPKPQRKKKPPKPLNRKRKFHANKIINSQTKSHPRPGRIIKTHKPVKRIKPKLSAKTKTKAEKEYLSQVAALGCLICQSPAEIHHIRSNMGLGRRNSHFMVLPLCPTHHRTGGHGIAFHAASKIWQDRYGTETELLNKVHEMLELEQTKESC